MLDIYEFRIQIKNITGILRLWKRKSVLHKIYYNGNFNIKQHGPNKNRGLCDLKFIISNATSHDWKIQIDSENCWKHGLPPEI